MPGGGARARQATRAGSDTRNGRAPRARGAGRTSRAGGANRARRTPEGGATGTRRGTRASGCGRNRQATLAGISGSGAGSGCEVKKGLFNQVPKEIWLKTRRIREGVRILTRQRAVSEAAGDGREQVVIFLLGALRTLGSSGGDMRTGVCNQFCRISDVEPEEGVVGSNSPLTAGIQYVLGHCRDQRAAELGRVDVVSGVGAATFERDNRRLNGTQCSLEEHRVDVIGTAPCKDLVGRGADLSRARPDGQARRGGAGDVIRPPLPAPMCGKA